MFRITRGHHVQHVHLPMPVIRDLDALDDEAVPENASPTTAAEKPAVEADDSAPAPR